MAKKIYRIGSSLTSSSSSSSSTAKGEVEADTTASSWGSSTAGVNVIKLFSSPLTAGESKLECLPSATVSGHRQRAWLILLGF